MGLRDLLKKKDDLAQEGLEREETVRRLNGPEFTFIRSDTLSHEVIQPPEVADDHYLSAEKPTKPRRSLDVFRSGRSRDAPQPSAKDGGHRRLSQRLHLSRQPDASENVPTNLPAIVVPPGDEAQDKDGVESEWEKRATMLANQNERARSRPASPVPPSPGASQGGLGGGKQRSRSPSASKAIDEDIQEAIRLHEEGNLEQSTRLFGQLADPNGANNPLSQVLYGLALRLVSIRRNCACVSVLQSP